MNKPEKLNTAGKIASAKQDTTLDQHCPESASQTDTSAGAESPVTETPHRHPKFGGYQIEHEIARGGMGIVLSAFESELNRTVAIKTVIAAKNARAAHARFLRESQIAARLTHPSIPPVHRLDRTNAGQPFLVMKLIKGDTLASLLAARRAPEEDMGRFIQIFEQVSQAVGFAHSQGIVHRDIKPSNVMVGEFGEVQLMDWGLAKVLEGDEPVEFDTENEMTDEAATRFGTVMGSPLYMSPEQARGEQVDTTTDVFSLGSLLCVLLTGQAPFENKTSSAEIIRSTAFEEFDDVFDRLDACSADEELVALAKTCLSPDPKCRPSNAREVANSVTRYRQAVEKRLRESESERAATEVRIVEQGKRRRVATAATAIVFMALVAGAAAALSQAQRAYRAESDTRAQLTETQKAKQEADVSRDQAKQRYDIALDAFTEMVSSIQTRLSNEPKTLALRMELLTNARGGLARLLDADQRSAPGLKLIWAHVEMGKLETLLAQFDSARQNFETADKLISTHLESAPNELEAIETKSAVLAHLGDEQMRLNQTEKALAHYEEKLILDRELMKSFPQDLDPKREYSIGLARLGRVALQHGQVEKAHQYFLEKLAIAQQLVAEDPANEVFERDLAISHEYLGDSAKYVGDLELAEKSYVQLNHTQLRRLEENPESVTRIRDVVVSYTKLGELGTRRGESNAALDYFAKAAMMLEKQVELDPNNIQHKLELFISYDNLGFTEFERRDYAKAIAWFRKGHKLIQPLHDKGMLVGQFKDALAATEDQIEQCERELSPSESP